MLTAVADPLPTDLEIARRASLLPVEEVAAAAGIGAEHLEPLRQVRRQGRSPAQAALAERPAAKYVVITAVTPTPLGEGKTTTSIGLAQGLAALGHSSMLSLRQPSLGPTFGIKGGAAGAGWSQVVPMEAVNLHLTGDFHAVTSAHNLLAAMVDNHLHHGNELDIDVRTHRLATGPRRQRPGSAPHRRRTRRARATASPARRASTSPPRARSW